MQRFYHITYSWKGEEIWVYPRHPESAEGIGEPVIPRICVCPTIEQCAWAAGYDSICSGGSVYYTDTDIAVPCYGVHDSLITDEHWLLEPARFIKLFNFPQPDFNYYETGMKMRRTKQVNLELDVIRESFLMAQSKYCIL